MAETARHTGSAGGEALQLEEDRAVKGGHQDVSGASDGAQHSEMAEPSAPPVIKLNTVAGFPSPPGLQYPCVSPSTSTTSSTASLSSLSLSDQVSLTYKADHDHDMDSPPQLAPDQIPHAAEYSQILHESDEALNKWRRQLGLDGTAASKRGPTTPDPTVICPPKPKTLRSSFDANDAQHSVGPSFDVSESDRPVLAPPLVSRPCPPLITAPSSTSTYTMSSVSTITYSHEPHRARRDSHSPSNSPASTAREGLTPKAELPPPVWPMSSADPSNTTSLSPRSTPSSLAAVSDVQPPNLSASPMSIDDVLAMQNGMRSGQGHTKLERSGSWRKKFASLDTVPNGVCPPTTLGRAPSSEEIRGRQHASSPYPPVSSVQHTAHTGRRYSANAYQVNANEKLLAFGGMTGCRISAPISPPSHYPAASSRRASSRSSATSSTHRSSDASRDAESTGEQSTSGCCAEAARSMSPSACSSTSTSSSSALTTSCSSTSTIPSAVAFGPPRLDTAGISDSYPTFVTPDTPRWARPMRHTNAMSRDPWTNDKFKGLSTAQASLGSEEEEDFDQDMFNVDGEEDGPVEVIKGEQGRIAVRSTTKMYEILVWLPGFSMGDITIAGRAHKTLHVVADKWDEGDHVSNYIKLGEDADMKSIGAKFNGQELRVTVGRLSSANDMRSIKTSTSLPAGTATAGTAFATTGYAGQRQSTLQAKTMRSASASSPNKPSLAPPPI